MSKLRKLANGQFCQIRLSGICNHNPSTTVLAHFRMAGVSGMGIKPPDLLGSWACSACHAYVDTHSDEETKLSFALGVLRTQNELIKGHHVKW